MDLPRGPESLQFSDSLRPLSIKLRYEGEDRACEGELRLGWSDAIIEMTVEDGRVCASMSRPGCDDRYGEWAMPAGYDFPQTLAALEGMARQLLADADQR